VIGNWCFRWGGHDGAGLVTVPIAPLFAAAPLRFPVRVAALLQTLRGPGLSEPNGIKKELSYSVTLNVEKST
jgi:hypothetical protein